jgi:transglutaminase-like putative cysteine protease
MMKRIVLLVLVLVVASCGGSQNEFKARSWNGEFVQEMSDSYEYFLENNKLPETVTVDGVEYDKGKMFAASHKLLLKMIEEPKKWQRKTVEFNDTISFVDNERNNTLNIDEISLEDFVALTEKAYKYGEENGVFPKYCILDENYVHPADSSKYSTNLISNSMLVGFTRFFHHYVQTLELPQTVSTWHSDFLRSATNCPKEDSLVVATMKQITEGKATTYDKAKALFEHALNEWNWQNYYNSSKGAAKTIYEKGGNCCDLSHALVAMGRAAGIPSRYRHAQCKYIKSGRVIGHVMAEYYVDGVWYLCDPSSKGTTFGNHEAWAYMDTFNGYYNELPF